MMTQEYKNKNIIACRNFILTITLSNLQLVLIRLHIVITT